jgi:hypothetical protein
MRNLLGNVGEKREGAPRSREGEEEDVREERKQRSVHVLRQVIGDMRLVESDEAI